MRSEDFRVPAAVLAYFEPEWLLGDRAEPATADLSRFLVADCDRVIGEDGGLYWSLNEDARAATLRQVPRDELTSTLAALPRRPDVPLQTVLDRFVAHDPFPVDRMSLAEIDATLRLSRWVDPATAGLPPVDQLEDRHEWRLLTDALRHLLDDGFFGRGDLLSIATAHIEGHDPRPLGLWGPGGSGKSTLLARLLLDRPDVPFVYLNFDRGQLAKCEPAALGAELVRQLALQVDDPAIRPVLRDVQRIVQTTDRTAFEADDLPGRTVAASHSDRAADFQLGLLRPFLERLPRLVVVLETYEEILRRDRSFGDRLWALLERWSAAAAGGLRILVAGRSLPRERIGEAHFVDALAPADARRLLRALLGDRAGSDEALDTAIGLVGANPLNLKLAAEVLRRSSGDDPLRFVELAQGQVQGVLYARILDHIADPRVRALAHPGLVVRRITPEVIAEVLAGPCGLTVEGPDDARRLFDALRAEATLVDEVGVAGDVLVHRPDVRELMLPNLRRADPDTVAEIHHRAALYYADQEGLEARTEELYHRLMLDDEESYVFPWDPEATVELIRAFDELPPRARFRLATLVDSLRVDPELAREAEDAGWLAVTRPRVERRIVSGQLVEALELLQERRVRGTSLLPVHEAEVLERLGRFRESLDLVHQAMGDPAHRADLATARALALVEVRVMERLGLVNDAFPKVDALVGATGLHPHPRDDEIADRLVTLTIWLRLERKQRRRDPKRRPPVVDEARRLAHQLPRRELRRRASLLRDLAAELGSEAPDILALADDADYSVPIPAGAPRGHAAAPSPAAIQADQRVREYRRASEGALVSDVPFSALDSDAPASYLFRRTPDGRIVLAEGFRFRSWARTIDVEPEALPDLDLHPPLPRRLRWLASPFGAELPATILLHALHPREAEATYDEALQGLRVPLVRRALLTAFVRPSGRRRFAWGLGQALADVLLVVGALTTTAPLLVGGALLPLLLAALWGRRFGQGVLAGYALLLSLPLATIQRAVDAASWVVDLVAAPRSRPAFLDPAEGAETAIDVEWMGAQHLRLTSSFLYDGDVGRFHVSPSDLPDTDLAGSQLALRLFDHDPGRAMPAELLCDHLLANGHALMPPVSRRQAIDVYRSALADSGVPRLQREMRWHVAQLVGRVAGMRGFVWAGVVTWMTLAVLAGLLTGNSALLVTGIVVSPLASVLLGRPLSVGLIGAVIEPLLLLALVATMLPLGPYLLVSFLVYRLRRIRRGPEPFEESPSIYLP